MLYFQPDSGRSIRVDCAETANLRRRAPRVVLFALSHACNLRCSFCSRDQAVVERWDADEAFGFLATLADAGTLEVAFGGGEPLAYAGFADLVQRLGARTSIAVSFTTNGTLLDEVTARALAPWVGEVRVSIYEDNDWAGAMGHLVDAGVRTAANVLVDPGNLAVLPCILDQLGELGCDNVALLRYVGGDSVHHLRDADWAALEQMVRMAPLPVRLSRCFADRMPELPRLFDGASADCGAGRDFVVVGPDKTLRACSFHQTGYRFRDAHELLALYQRRSYELSAPAILDGCARPLGATGRLSPGIRIYEGFASNNSGDTVLVARFESVEEPRELAQLLAILDPQGEPDEWRAFLRSEGCDPTHQDIDVQVEAAGRSLLVTGYDAEDALPGIRELVWRRGAPVVLSAIHLHEGRSLLVGLGDANDSLETQLWAAGADAVEDNNGFLFATFPGDPWPERLENARALAEEAKSPFAAELVIPQTDERLVDGCKSAVAEGAEGYLEATFLRSDDASAFAASLGDGVASLAGSTVLVELDRVARRLALRAQQAGAACTWHPRQTLRLTGVFYRRDYRDGAVEPESVAHAIERTTGFTLGASYLATVARLSTKDPRLPMLELQRAATELGVALHVTVQPSRPLAISVGRMRKDLRALSRSVTDPD